MQQCNTTTHNNNKKVKVPNNEEVDVCVCVVYIYNSTKNAKGEEGIIHVFTLNFFIFIGIY